ncbi:LOW QUALITY PROTEIN: uncharacterized protein WM277_015343 [Molossus nigricans]
MDAIYKIASTGRIQAPETELAVQLTELKSETEEQGRYWKQPLELVAKSKPLAMQANVMQRELESCLRREYTPENLPLLLLQHYTERTGQLALSKYLHTLRWKRFCQHSKIMEQLYPLYKKQVAYIMQEHSDALQRADRLSVAQEKFLMGKNNPPTLVTQEDLTIYTKWLVCHLHSLKTIHHYLQTLQYLPISSVLTVAVDGVSEVGQENEKVHVNDTSPDIQGSASPGHVDANISESMRTEAAFVLPQHMTETEELKPQLRLLLLPFTILYDVEELRAAAKEIELFALAPDGLFLNIKVSQKFQKIFIEQQRMQTFPKYDAGKAEVENVCLAGPGTALEKSKLDFLYKGEKTLVVTYLSIKPKCDPWQKKLLIKLKERRIDVLMQLQAKYNYARALQLLGLDDGPDGDPVLMRGTSLFFLYLRHLPIRELQRISLGILNYFRSVERTLTINTSGLTLVAGSLVPTIEESSWVNMAKGGLGTLQGLGAHHYVHGTPAEHKGHHYNLCFCLHVAFSPEQLSPKFRPFIRTPVLGGGLILMHYDPILLCEHLQRLYFQKALHTFSMSTALCTEKKPTGCHLGKMQLSLCWELPGSALFPQVRSTQFTKFSTLEDQDDYYSMDSGCVHTQDQQGVRVMYDGALSDLEDLEAELQLVASHYIEKEKARSSLRWTLTPRHMSNWTSFPRGLALLTVLASPPGHQEGSESSPGRVWERAHAGVDRFAVLYEWTWEAARRENKRQLLDCYFEAYQHVLDPEEGFAIAQVITDITHRCPRFDLSHPHFLKSYQDECARLRLHQQLVRGVLSQHMEHVQRLRQEGCLYESNNFGLLLNIICEHLISINNSCPALKSIYLLEFHPSLPASLIPRALEHLFQEARHTQAPSSSLALLERRVLQLALDVWLTPAKPESWGSARLQKDDYLHSRLQQLKGQNQGQDSQVLLLETFSKLLDLLTLCHQLTEMSLESVLLARSVGGLRIWRGDNKYSPANEHRCHLNSASKCQLRKMEKCVRMGELAWEMGFEEFHLCLRPVHFEFASQKDKVDHPPPIFITSLLENSDLYSPTTRVLAISEVDDNQVDKFSFYTKEAILKLSFHSGVENTQVTLACQAAQKNAVMVSVQYAFFYHTAPETFVSIQLEKVGLRDLTPNAFLHRKQTRADMTKSLVNAKEHQKDRSCFEGAHASAFMQFNHHMSHYALRGQIMAYCDSLRALLEDFPAVRDTFFVMEQPQEKKELRDSKEGLTADLRDPEIMTTVKKYPYDTQNAPKRMHTVRDSKALTPFKGNSPILTSATGGCLAPETIQPLAHAPDASLERRCAAPASPLRRTQPGPSAVPDGQVLPSVPVTPHPADLLATFKTRTEQAAFQAVELTLQLTASLHDIVACLFSVAKLGDCPACFEFPLSHNPLRGDWGVTEGIVFELQELQTMIDSLSPQDPTQVSQALLLREVVFDAAVRPLVRRTFLTAGNVPAYQSVTGAPTMHGLPPLSNSLVKSIFAFYSRSGNCLKAEPGLEVSHGAFVLFPWRAFLEDGGLFPVSSSPDTLEYNMQLCLCRLSDRDLKVAHGELVGMLLMEDVVIDFDNLTCDDSEICISSYQIHMLNCLVTSQKHLHPSISEIIQLSLRGVGAPTPMLFRCQLYINKGPEVSSRAAKAPKPLGGPCDAVMSLALLGSFLALWKQLEVRKEQGGRLKLRGQDVHLIGILYPSMKAIARRTEKEDKFEECVVISPSILPPEGASEIEIKTQQLQALLENPESHMIQELLRKVNREITLSEKSKEQRTLPTDLWKHVMKENFSLIKPQIVENFMQRLMENYQDGRLEPLQITFRTDHREACLLSLGCDVMARERSSFESYSVCYEHLSEHVRQKLRQKEQVCPQRPELQWRRCGWGGLGVTLKRKVKQKVGERCELDILRSGQSPPEDNAELGRNVTVEITALRARLADLEEEHLNLEHIREEVQEEEKLDENQLNLIQKVSELISEVRAEWMDHVKDLKKKWGSARPDEGMKENAAKEQLWALEQEHCGLAVLVTEQLGCSTCTEGYSTQLYPGPNGGPPASSSLLCAKKLPFSCPLAFPCHGLIAERVRTQVDQEALHRRQLDSPKTCSMEKLLAVEQKEQHLQLPEEAERAAQRGQLQREKTQRELPLMPPTRRSRLAQASVKLDASQRVELRSQLSDAVRSSSG